MRRITRLLATGVLSVFLPAAASAAGFEYVENGAKALAQGGAFTAAPSDATAMYYNPAGLAGQTGFRLILDGHFVWLNHTFQRTDGGSTAIGEPVENTHQPWIAPMLALTYGITDNLTVGVGAWGPAAYGAVEFADPRDLLPSLWDGDPGNNPSQAEIDQMADQAPQRYDLIERQVIVAYPSLGVGWQPVPWLSLGATGQVVLANTTFSKAIYGGTSAGEDAAYDAIASLDVNATPVVTGIFGAQVFPTEGLSLGFSVRPGFQLESDGDLDIQFSDSLQALAGAAFNSSLEQRASDATFTNNFPWVFRSGLQVGKAGWHLAADFVYETWSDVESLDLDPAVDIQLCRNDDPSACQPVEIAGVRIPKQWDDTISLRFGGALDLDTVGLQLPLTVRAGYAFETAAAPADTFSLDFPSGQRNQFTLGFTYDYDWLAVTLTGSHIFQDDVTVRSSQVVQEVSPPPGLQAPTPQVVGSGTHEVGYTFVVLGLEGKFGGS